MFEKSGVQEWEAISYAGAACMESDSVPICGLKSKGKPVGMQDFFPFKAHLESKSGFYANFSPAEKWIASPFNC